MTQLVDQWGQPLRKQLLTREVAAATLAGVRQPTTGYPGDGLNPRRLSRILRSADQSDPLEYFELAETIEERDLHYAGVLATRKRSVSQIDITVEAGSEDADGERRAEMVREWLKRDELADEMFDILDAVGKGISYTEIVWDTSSGQWRPDRLERVDQRWTTFDRDGKTPLLRGGIEGNGQDEPLPAFKFIRAAIKAKSGLPVRSGIARLAAWAWMFKAYTQRDWAIFTQTYGQPIRVGKYHSGATEEDKKTLYRAVANIAGDCAALVPEGMLIEFIESKNVSSGSDLYEKRADWLDRQISKGVLGQTTTTDAVSGGHAVSQEHRLVQEDIETADCKALAAVINRDLIRTWCDLEYGQDVMLAAGYPRVVIARPKQEDLELLTSSIERLVPLGMKVKQSEIRDKFGLSKPEAGDEVLEARKSDEPELPALPAPPLGLPAPKRGEEAETALHARQAPASDSEAVGEQSRHPAAAIAAAMEADAGAAIEEMTATIETMMAQASDLGELRVMLSAAYPSLDASKLAGMLASGMVAAHAAGRSDAVDESE